VRRFEGRNILITGATSGIGLAAAGRLAEEGAVVTCVARSAEKLVEVTAQLAGSGHRALALDASNETAIDAAYQQLKSEGMHFDGAVLAAGQHALRPLQLLKASNIDAMLALNVRGVLLTTKLAMRLASKEGASIVWLSSVAAAVGNPAEAVYAASKGALVSACRSLAAELAPRRIRINTLLPGVVETPMSDAWLNQLTPEQKEAVRARHLLGFGQPTDVAAAALFLLSEDARWITGSSLVIDGGLSCHS
jgi:NAD(P)-dependent dehydrogenase (short-subunit alcohol dehydrogenase family)